VESREREIGCADSIASLLRKREIGYADSIASLLRKLGGGM